MKIVMFNGPPRSGKDSCANLLVDYVESKTTRPIYRRALSMPLRLMAFGALQREYDEKEFERLKPEMIPLLGITTRQFQIDASEKFMKPLYGESVFARLLIESIPEQARNGADPLVVVSDGGFQVEIDVLSEYVGKENLALCQVYRQGTTFAGDSRSYITNRGGHFCRIENNADIESLHENIVHVASWLNGMWDL